MDIVMLHTITDSINRGRTRQTFVAGQRYELPLQIGQIWIGRGWAKAAATIAPAAKGKE